MKKTSFPASPIQTQYIKFFGGIDMTTPVLSLKPGNALEAMNYEPGLNGGYKRIDGFERFDGRPAPSNAVYSYIEATFSALVVPGAVITGATSGATATVVKTDADNGAISVVRVAGEFVMGESFTVGGVVAGHVASLPARRGYRDAFNDAAAQAAAADAYRADIAAVPGQGPVRGVWMHKGVLYAFRDKAGGAAAGMYKATSAGWAEIAIAYPPGGRYEFVSTNFGGASSTYRMYGCSGVGPAFEFDGATFTTISTGMTVDTPKFIAAHKKKLFLSFGSSVQFSGDGDPFQWTVLSGASEFGVGADITGMAVQTGDTLAIFTRNSSWQLNGSTINSFALLPISDEVGALPYTVQNVGKTYALDDRGIISTDRTQAYGNFNQASISAAVQPLIDQLRTKATGGMVYRSRNQYRILGADGSGVIAGFKDGALIGITQLQYPVNPTCMASCEDGTGKDVVFFGADNGFVYQADVGSSFDGAPIEAYLRMPFNNIGGPRLRKRFRKVVLEMSAVGYAAIRFQPEFSYGDPDVGSHRVQTGEIAGAGGYWDVDNWDEFFYGAQFVSSPAFSIEGTGVNMSMIFYSASVIDHSHTLQGLLVHFSPKRLER